MKLYIVDSIHDIRNVTCYDNSHDYLVVNEFELLEIDFSKITHVILLSELTWSVSGQNMLPEMHYGVSLLRTYLRSRKKLIAPILIISKYPESELLKFPGNYIINAVGQKFRMYNPFEKINTSNEFNSQYLKPLSEIQLNDLINNYCYSSGQIGEIIHRAKGSISNILNNDELGQVAREDKSIDILHSALDEIFTILPYSDSLDYLKTDLLSKFHDVLRNNNVGAETFLQQHEEMLRSLSSETETQPTPIAREFPWKILFLDDEPDSIKPIINALHSNSVTTIVCSHVDEAQIAIEEDEKNGNFISVLISDYRLFEQGTTRHQSRQGYDFLLDTSQRDRFTSFVALSGLGRQFLLESFRKYNLRVEVYSKDDLRSSERARQVFAENIVQLGEETHKALLSQPVVGLPKWNNVLKPFYLAYRNSIKYTQYEQDIRKSARRYVLTIKNIFDDTDPNRLQLSVITNFPGLRTKLISVDNQKHIDTFVKILQARRIAIWLIFIQGFDTKTVYAIINDGELDSSYLNRDDLKEKDDIKGNVNGLLNTYLCISTKEFPEGLLVEEVAWLKYDMGIDIYDMRIVLSQVHEHFNECLKRYPQLLQVMAKWSELEEDFINNNLVLVSLGDVKRVARCMAEKIRDVQEVKIAIQMLQQCLAILEKDHNCLLISDDLKEYVQSKINILYKFN
jgi:hypothetical protein